MAQDDDNKLIILDYYALRLLPNLIEKQKYKKLIKLNKKRINQNHQKRNQNNYRIKALNYEEGKKKEEMKP